MSLVTAKVKLLTFPVYGHRVSFLGVNRPGRGVNHLPHLSLRLKKEYSYTSTPPLDFNGLFYGEHYLYLYLLPFYLTVLPFALSNVTNILILIILYNFFLL